MNIRNVLVKHRWIRVFCMAFVLIFCLSVPVLALEDEASLPHVSKWVNGLGVSEDGVYLSDTWAVDDTGITDKDYVLLDQGCAEIMRIENYPEGLTDGDTTPCVKHFVAASLVVPEGVTGDVYVTLKNDVAEYSLCFSEEDAYKLDAEVYPGTYEVSGVEASFDVGGTYRISNYHSIAVSSDMTVSFEIAAEVDGASTGETAGGQDSVEAGEDGDEDSSGERGDNNDLLADTVKLFVVVVVLLSVYAIIKYRRAKSEEIKQ